MPLSSSAPPTPISAETTSLSPTAVVGQVSVVLRPDRRLRGVLYVAVDHTANLRRGSRVSAVWDHGGEYVSIMNPLGCHY